MNENINPISSKSCKKCLNVKPLTSFRRQSSTSDGYKYVCKECDSLVAKERYQKNRSRLIELSKEWQKKNKDKAALYSRRYKEKKKLDS